MSAESSEQPMSQASWVPSLSQNFALPTLGDLESTLGSISSSVNSSLEKVRSNVMSISQDILKNAPTTFVQQPPQNEDVSLVNRVLPKEILLLIFSHLDINSLIKGASQSCKKWHQFIEDDALWESLYKREVGTWNSYSTVKFNRIMKGPWDDFYSYTQKAYGKFFGTTEPETKSSVITWKHKYLVQHQINSESYNKRIKSRAVPAQNYDRKMAPTQTSTLSAFSLVQKLCRVMIVGEGLETTSKTLVYHMMWGEDSPFKMTKLYPGTGGIGSGVGFEIDGVDLNVSAIYDHEKLFQTPDGLEQWVNFLKETDGLMFVMDMCGNTITVKNDLEILLQSKNGLPPTTPLVVLACTGSKSNVVPTTTTADEESPKSAGVFDNLTPAEIAEKLDLDSLNRPWLVRRVDVSTLDGMYQSFDWLFSYL